MASGAAALKKIRARVKQLQEKHPGAKYKTLQKQAGRELRGGKLKTRKPRKKAAPKKRSVKRKVRRRRVSAVSKVGTVRRVVRRRKRRAVAKRTVRRRVGSRGKSFMPLILLGAAAIGIYLLVKNRQQPVTVIQTPNPIRNQTSSDILQYAQAANLTAAAIANLIKQINASNDSGVQNIYDTIKTNPGAFENVAGVGYVQNGYNRPQLGY